MQRLLNAATDERHRLLRVHSHYCGHDDSLHLGGCLIDACGYLLQFLVTRKHLGKVG